MAGTAWDAVAKCAVQLVAKALITFVCGAEAVMPQTTGADYERPRDGE